MFRFGPLRGRGFLTFGFRVTPQLISSLLIPRGPSGATFGISKVSVLVEASLENRRIMHLRCASERGREVKRTTHKPHGMRTVILRNPSKNTLPKRLRIPFPRSPDRPKSEHISKDVPSKSKDGASSLRLCASPPGTLHLFEFLGDVPANMLIFAFPFGVQPPRLLPPGSPAGPQGSPPHPQK